MPNVLTRQTAEEPRALPDVLMLRHCESNGWTPDAPLTRRGYEQADRLTQTLADMPIDYVASSPFRRATETVSPFAQSRSLQIHTDARLEERRRSNKPLDNWREWVKQSFLDLDYRAPGGESGREVAGRASTVLSECLRSSNKLPLLSTHGQLMSFLANSIDPEFGYERASLMSYPALLRFRLTNAGIAFETLF